MNFVPSLIHVLLIDDDPDDHLMFKDLLSQVRGQKYKIDWASSYEEGLARISDPAAKYDVCFMDFRLGSHTGLDILKEGMKAGWQVPMILLTGYGEPEVDMEAMRLGAADYLVKDQVTPLLLERSIRYSVYRAGSLRALLEREAQIVMQDRLASVGMLASSLAHEIGTPLGVIRGRAEYLEMRLGENLEAVKTAGVIISQIDRVSKLIRSLLTLARGESRKPVEPVAVGSIFEELTDLMGHDLRRASIDFRLGIPPELRVRAEQGPLHQVLLNLLVNSVHAIEEAIKAGRTQHHIQVTAEDQGDSWAIQLRDTGQGISPANMKKLFRPFFTTKDIGKGTGLGLATSYRIVESWGGTIEVQSEVGKGATFTIKLPKG